MVQTIKEFVDEMRMLRKEMYLHGEKADTKLVASWLDRLVISMEKVGPTLDMMAVEIGELATAEPLASTVRTRSAKSAKPKNVSSSWKAPKASKPAKNVAKKAAKKGFKSKKSGRRK
ncbi:MAG: hypothetical protein ABII71_00745 [Candidatus Micrarchaeota archaeon]